MPLDRTDENRFQPQLVLAFLEDVARDQVAGYLNLRAERDHEVVDESWPRLATATALVQGVRWIGEWTGRANVLVGSAPRLRQRGRDSDSPIGWIVSADLDSDAALDAYTALRFPATWEIASGGRTGSGRPKMHVHWVLERPLPMPDLRRLHRQIAAALRADTRFNGNVLRVPGTPNVNYKPPRAVELIAHRPERVDTACLRRHLPAPNPFIEISKRREAKRRASRTTAHEIVAEAIERDACGGGSGDPVPFFLALHLRDALFTENITRDALDTFNASRERKQRCSDGQLDGIIRALYRDDDHRGFRTELRGRIEDVIVLDLPHPQKAVLLALHLLADQRLAQGHPSFTLTASYRLISEMTNASDEGIERAIGRLKGGCIEPMALIPSYMERPAMSCFAWVALHRPGQGERIGIPFDSLPVCRMDTLSL